jgi:UPF0716 protein FxsA
MALYLIIGFIIYGWVEFEAMAHVVDGIGGLFAFIGIFVTAFIGVRLLRSQSAIVMAQFRADAAKGHMNSGAIASSLSLLAGAILMLIPGYVTDTLGLLCFVPGLRQIIGAFIAARFSAGMMANAARFQDRGGFASAFQDASHFDRNPQNDDTTTAQKTTKFPSDSDIIEGDFKEKN